MSRVNPPESDWDDYPRIASGPYQAYCKRAVEYQDFGRHKVMLLFDVFASDGTVIATLPAFFDRGDARKGKKPHSGRRSRYWECWLRANGGPPDRHDRLSLRVFPRRMATVEVEDTKLNHEHLPTLAPYSVVRSIVEWHTGISRSRVKRSHSKSTKVKEGIPKVTNEQGVTGSPWQEESASLANEALGKASVLAGIEGESKPLKPKGGSSSNCSRKGMTKLLTQGQDRRKVTSGREKSAASTVVAPTEASPTGYGSRQRFAVPEKETAAPADKPQTLCDQWLQTYEERQATSTGGSRPQLTEKIPEAAKGEAREQAPLRLDDRCRYCDAFQPGQGGCRICGRPTRQETAQEETP